MHCIISVVMYSQVFKFEYKVNSIPRVPFRIMSRLERVISVNLSLCRAAQEVTSLSGAKETVKVKHCHGCPLQETINLSLAPPPPSLPPCPGGSQAAAHKARHTLPAAVVTDGAAPAPRGAKMTWHEAGQGWGGGAALRLRIGTSPRGRNLPHWPIF